MSFDANARPAAAASLKQTMLGMSPNAAPVARPVPSEPQAPKSGQQAPRSEQPTQPRPSPAPGTVPLGKAGTMLGLQSPFAVDLEPRPPRTEPVPATAPVATAPAGAPAPAPSSQAAGLKRTMLGFAAPAPPAPEVAPAAAPVLTETQPAGSLSSPKLGLGGTLIYNPPPGTPEAPPLARQSAPEPLEPQPVEPQPGAQAALPTFQRTMLGVARPGIAPLRPGSSDRPPARTVQQVPAQAPPAPMPVPPSGLSTNSVPKRSGFPRGGTVLTIVSGLLAVTAGVVAFLWESPRPMRAQVALDDRGNEALALTCDDCVDGTAVSIGASKATFHSKKAQLPLNKPLEIGANKQVVSVRRPGIGRDEEVVLTVPIDYRVRGVLTGLAEDPPKLKVAVQAMPGSSAIVDGRAVPLDATGKGEHSVDVSKELEGPADTILPFEKKLPYVVTPPNSEPHKGEVTLRFGIVPLRVEAPTEGIVVEGETFMLSGHTLKDGRITVGGRPITVDAEGRFAQLMNVSSVGETTIVVRAEAKDHAPRFVRVRVKRVRSLRDEAALFRQTAVSDYATVAADPKKGEAIAFDGEVVEARLAGEVTILLLDVKKGCARQPCLARVVYGGRFETTKGASVGAFGRLHGNVDGPRTGAQIPEIFAEFLLPLKQKP
jgi:hypothetical protein